MDYKKVKQVLWIILLINLSVAFIKLVIGGCIHSAVMLADGFHSLTDGCSNVIGLIGIQLALKPVDKEHPYGHKKFETLAALIIAVMLMFIGINIINKSIENFFNPEMPEVTPESLIMLIITLIINVFVNIYEFRKGKELNSKILISDSLHTKSDIFVSFGVLVTLFCVKLGLSPIVDQIASLIVAAFIIYAGIEILKDNSDVLVDKAAVDTQVIRDIVLSFDKVMDAHNIRSRGYENDLYLDMHILISPDMSVSESHKLIHNIEELIKVSLDKEVQMIAHLEPFSEAHAMVKKAE